MTDDYEYEYGGTPIHPDAVAEDEEIPLAVGGSMTIGVLGEEANLIWGPATVEVDEDVADELMGHHPNCRSSIGFTPSEDSGSMDEAMIDEPP